MENNQNHQLSKCQNHSFSLRALYKEKRHSLNANITMCRAKQVKNKKNKAKCANYEGPILNRDKCHASPAFILPSEKINYLQSARQIMRQHQKRVKESEEQIDDFYIPKPRSKSIYCNVCRQNYQQYLDHIQSRSHKLNIRNSEFNSHILDLQKKLKKVHTNDVVISSTESEDEEEIDESVEISRVSGRKKIQIQNQQHANTNFCPFLNQNLNYSMPATSYNSLSFPQFQTMFHPFNFPSNSNLLYKNNLLNSVNCNPFANLLQQQYLNYPLFCMQFQPSLNYLGFNNLLE